MLEPLEFLEPDEVVEPEEDAADEPENPRAYSAVFEFELWRKTEHAKFLARCLEAEAVQTQTADVAFEQAEHRRQEAFARARQKFQRSEQARRRQLADVEAKEAAADRAEA